MQGNEQRNPFEAPPVVAVVVTVVQAFAVTMEVFLRRRIGSRYLDRQSALALILIPCFGLLFPGEDLEPLMCLLGCFMLACMVIRARSLRRRLRGVEEHSRYTGWPRVLSLPLFSRLDEVRAKVLVEPLLVGAVGVGLLGVNRPLGSYLMVTAFCLFVGEGMRRAFEERRLLDMKDAMADQRRLAERFRQKGW